MEYVETSGEGDLFGKELHLLLVVLSRLPLNTSGAIWEKERETRAIFQPDKIYSSLI